MDDNGRPPEYLNAFTSLFISLIGINGILKSNLHPYALLLYTVFIINGVSSFFYHLFDRMGLKCMDESSAILISLSILLLLVDRFTPFYKNISYLIIILYSTVACTLLCIGNDYLYNIVLTFSVIVIIIIATSLQVPAEINKIKNIGILLITIGGLLYLYTKIFIEGTSVGHALWHICISLGLYLVSIAPQYLYQTGSIQYDWIGLPYIM